VSAEAALERWEVAAALVPEATWDQLEAMRRAFPELERALPGPWAVRWLIERVRVGQREAPDEGPTLLLTSRHEELLLDKARSMPEFARAVDAMLLDQLGATEPTDALAAAQWQAKTAWIRSRMEPQRAVELLAKVLDGPLSEGLKARLRRELERQRRAPAQGGLSAADTKVLAASLGLAEGVPARAVVWGAWRAMPALLQAAGAFAWPLLVSAATGLLLPVVNERAWGPSTPARAPATSRLAEESGTLRPRMIRIEAGSFVMGSPGSEAGRLDDEQQHPVRITRPFELAETEVTQGQYRRLMGEAPFVEEYSGVSLLGEDLPAQNVSWEDAVRYCNVLSTKEGLEPAYDLSTDPPTWRREATGYRLPTEAEWEFAARAGTATRFVGTDDETAVCGQDNVADSTAVTKFGFSGFTCDDRVAGLAPVKGFATNAASLYGMGGNVAEWTWDVYADAPPGGDDPAVDSEGVSRVVRGGSWISPPQDARVADRGSRSPSGRNGYLGFRPARSPPP
jgi:formylglycine-generating enzyme required for sulfatase activity